MIENQDVNTPEIAAATDAFVAFRTLLKGKDRAYFTDEISEQNIKLLTGWALENDLDFSDMQTIGFWQIAFANCRDKLTVDPNAPIFRHERQLFRQRVGAMSVAEIKEAAKHEEGFAERYQALQAAEDVTFGVKGL
jgi:hypothetical protein